MNFDGIQFVLYYYALAVLAVLAVKCYVRINQTEKLMSL